MKKSIKEVPIFPNPCETGHNFTQYNDNSDPERAKGFYKNKPNGDHDTSQVFAMLFCTKCGATKEIAIINRRR